MPLWLALLSLSEVEVMLRESSSPPSLLGGEADVGVVVVDVGGCIPRGLGIFVEARGRLVLCTGHGEKFGFDRNIMA